MGAIVVILLFLLLLALLVGIWIGFLLARAYRKSHPGPPPPPPPPPSTGYKIPDEFGEADLSTALNVRLIGTAANGAPAAAAGSTAGTPAAPSKTVWVDHGNEVLVHLDSTTVRILDRMVLVSVDLETDQTGRTPLICSFAVSGAGELGGLVATTDELPRGSGLLASCWGKQLQTAVWSSLMGLANDHASERGLTPRALSAMPGKLSLSAGTALTTLSSSGRAA
jgi:hypothetical protein